MKNTKIQKNRSAPKKKEKKRSSSFFLLFSSDKFFCENTSKMFVCFHAMIIITILHTFKCKQNNIKKKWRRTID